MNYLANSFSLNMLGGHDGSIEIRRVPSNVVPPSARSIVGHGSTASILSSILKRHVPENRASVFLQTGDVLYVAQYVGPRLSEGATELPENARIDFYAVSVITRDRFGRILPRDPSAISLVIPLEK